MLAVVSLMGMPYTTLLPVIVTEQLRGGADLLGYLTAASGLGAMVGVLYLASRPSVLGLGRIIALAGGGFGLGLIAFGSSGHVALSLGFLFLAGMGMMVSLAAGNTVLQTIVDEDKRGRVMSLYTMAVAGMVPFGSLLSGVLARHLGAPNTVRLGGAACALGAAAFALALPRLREEVRPIYRRLGILPDFGD
jgi:MFS family permease